MNYTIPNKIKITSDNNILQFIKIKKVGKEELYTYRFIKSETKLNLGMSFSKNELDYQLRNFFKII